MTRFRVFGIAGLALVLLAGSYRAGEKEAPAKGDKKDGGANEALASLAALGPGVHKIKMDDKGRIQSAIIIGQSRISTVLGASKGLVDARTKSRLAAEGEFVKWLKTSVSVHAKNEEETILFLEGNEGADKDALRESGKSVEKTTQAFESRAQGLVRGLQVLGVDVNSKDKLYTLVMGWNAKTARATKKVQADLKEDEAPPAKGGKDAPRVEAPRDPAAPPSATKDNKKLQDKKIASPDLGDFLK